MWLLHKLTLQIWHSCVGLPSTGRGSFFTLATASKNWQYLHFFCVCGINLWSLGRNWMWSKVSNDGCVLLKRSFQVWSRCITDSTSPNEVASCVTECFVSSFFAQQMSDFMHQQRELHQLVIWTWGRKWSFNTKGVYFGCDSSLY